MLNPTTGCDQRTSHWSCAYCLKTNSTLTFLSYDPLAFCLWQSELSYVLASLLCPDNNSSSGTLRGVSKHHHGWIPSSKTGFLSWSPKQSQECESIWTSHQKPLNSAHFYLLTISVDSSNNKEITRVVSLQSLSSYLDVTMTVTLGNIIPRLKSMRSQHRLSTLKSSLMPGTLSLQHSRCQGWIPCSSHHLQVSLTSSKRSLMPQPPAVGQEGSEKLMHWKSIVWLFPKLHLCLDFALYFCYDMMEFYHYKPHFTDACAFSNYRLLKRHNDNESLLIFLKPNPL